MKTGDTLQVMVSDRQGVWLDAEVIMATEHGKPGVIAVDEGIPVPFSLLGDKQALCVVERPDGTFGDLFVSSRSLTFRPSQ